MDDLRRGVNRVHYAAAGVLAIQIVRYSDLPALLFAATGGDEVATRTIEILGKFLAGVDPARRGKRTLCATCDRALRRSGFACVIVWPFRDDAAEALCLAICASCVPGGSVADIEARALAFLKRIWPESRVLDSGQIHLDRGHA